MNNKSESYIQEVLRNLRAPAAKRQRIEADLRAHFREAETAGESAESVIIRLGTPAETAAELMSAIQMVHAGFFRRLAAFAIDITILMAVGAVYFAGLVALGNGGWTQGVDTKMHFDSILAAVYTILGAIAFGGVFILYFPLAEARFGRTPGKKALGLYVVKENGLPIGYKEAFLRRLSFFFNIFWVDALFVFFTEKRQRAFDIIAKTVVVREP